MDSLRCKQCSQTFCSRYNLSRHIRNKHFQHEAVLVTPRNTPQGAPGAHLGAPGAPPPPLGAPGAHLGAHLGAPPPPSGAPGAHLGAPPPPSGAPGAHLGAPGAPPPPLGAPGAHLGVPGALPPPPPPPFTGNYLSLAPPPSPLPTRQEEFKFQHPFTCIVSGPTSCWKTYFMVALLQRALNKIHPSPQRIIWLYKRWQPLYDVIRKTVVPKVEFIQGVPTHLEKDEFLNTTTRNLIILDDMAAEASKDQRVTDLFTEGSHHRNLSVIALNQNLYFSRDPTARRNTQYLVLFNNPVDRQPIATLARQMYPTNPKALIRNFDSAVSRTYGYLLLDLKPTTPEAQRMRTDIFGIKTTEEGCDEHSKEDSPSAQTYLPVSSSDFSTLESQYQIQDTMLSCDDCGVVFVNVHDLQNHLKRWCPERQPPKRTLDDDEDFLPSKKMKYDSEECNDSFEYLDEKSDDDTASKVSLNPWNVIIDEAFEKCQSRYDTKVNEIMEADRDMSEDEAKEDAFKDMKSAYMTAMMNSFIKKLLWFNVIKKDPIYKNIKRTVNRLIDTEDYEKNEALKYAKLKRQFLFDKILDTCKIPTTEEEVEDDDDDND